MKSGLFEKMISFAENDNPKVHISCVVDDDPKFRLQAWNWLLSLKSVDTKCRIFVHHISGSVSDAMRSEFTDRGATLVEIEPYGKGPAAYCNKIRQLETPEFLNADFVILSDADIGFLEDPAGLIRKDSFRAKLVDANNPPAEMWEALAEQVGLRDTIGTTEIEMLTGTETFATNFNGGLYVMPSFIGRNLLPLWRTYADECLAKVDILGLYALHSDQLGMGFAVTKAETRIDRLNAGDNLPTHLGREMLQRLEPQTVTSLHYHGHLDQHGLLKKTNVEWIDAAIESLNTAIVNERRKGFLNELFWDFRYTRYPELGSGLGSRGEILAFKQSLLKPYMEIIGKGTILDVGCGDLEVFADLPTTAYTGIDLSDAALKIARNKRPNWTFLSKDVSQFSDESFDYTSCIDVLIHQPSEDAARWLATDLVRVARKGIFFSVHSEQIEGSGISFNSEGIHRFISEMPRISGVHLIGTYRDVSLYFAEKGLGERFSPHDIGLQELVVGRRYAEKPATLINLVAYSRERIGFFPRTIIRAHEYPWFAQQMSEVEGKSVLDIGAGVCCLPLVLAERGAKVTTVDRHSRIRNREPKDQWNEWGYLDYAELDNRVRSFNTDASQFNDNALYDIIYSVSVIEHMTAELRRAVMKQIEKLLKPGGVILLSLDLVPETEELWNLNEGKIVDEVGHGDLDAFKAELAEVGLIPHYQFQIRNMPGSRTDVAYLTLRRMAEKEGTNAPKPC